MKRVAIIGTVGVPGRYGGFETLAHHLVENLSGKFRIKVYCSKKAYSKKERVKFYKGARLHYIPLSANGIQSTLYDFLSILHALFVADTLIILGVSGGLLVPFVRIFTRKKIIVNIDGLEWRREKWGKLAKTFLKFSEVVAVKWSHADITDNAAIKRYTSIQYKTLSNLIAYGGDHVIQAKKTKEDVEKYPFLANTYAFKVARIVPENNLHIILEAFTKISQTLVAVGNWQASDYGAKLVEKYGEYNNIHLLDPIYDQRELDVLRSNCLIYVHGHSAGGTNPSLVEAMSLGLPIAAFDCSFNRATTENTGLFFKSSEELQENMTNTSISVLLSMKTKMKEIANRRYTWKIIANQYANIIYAFDFKYRKNHLWSDVSRLRKETLFQNEIAHLENSTIYYEEL